MDLKKRATAIRKDVIRTITRAGKGHTAANLGIADIFTALYFGALKHNPRKPTWEERDRVFAASHYSPVWQTTLAHSGYFSVKYLFQGKKEIENHGVSAALGSALAAQMDNKKHQTYCIFSDQELNKGETWEVLMLAGKHRLNNFTLIIDRSNIQQDGYMEDVMPLEPLRAKLEAFNWNVIEVDGHNYEHLVSALKEPKSKPTIILAHTIPGKGVRFIENKYEWYAKAPTKEEENAALTELQRQT